MTPYVVMTISEKIKNLRKRTGKPQTEVAESLGVSQNLLSDWEQGRGLPRVPQLAALAMLIRGTVDYLVNEDDERTPAEVDAELEVRKLISDIGWEAARLRLIHADETKIPLQPTVGQQGERETGGRGRELDPTTGKPKGGGRVKGA